MRTAKNTCVGIVIVMVIFFMISSLFAVDQSTVVVSGFGQVKADSSGFAIPKVRVILSGPVEMGIKNVKVSYVTYTDFDKEGKPELGYAQINFQFPSDWVPKIIVGRTLDPTCYQFPGPHNLPVLNYPSALFSNAYGLGFFLQEDWKGVWAMAGVTNGTSKFKDDNKSLDFTGRFSYKLPKGFTVGVVCWSGQQPNGYRQIIGGDLTWQSSKIWINGGQNVIDYNGQKIGRWVMTTFDFWKYFQLVCLVESLKSGDKTANGWSAGVNFSPSQKNVIRVNLFQLASNSQKGWGILFQQKF